MQGSATPSWGLMAESLTQVSPASSCRQTDGAASWLWNQPISPAQVRAPLPCARARLAPSVPCQAPLGAHLPLPCLPLPQMFYAVSLLMVVVYAYEVKRALGGWREAPSSALLQVGRAWGPCLALRA